MQRKAPGGDYLDMSTRGSWLVSIAVWGSAAPGCGDNLRSSSDAGAAAAALGAAEPFAGQFDGPEDFPRSGCRPGALAGFASVGLWVGLGLRTALEGGALVTFASDVTGEVRAEHRLTSDDLLIRHVELSDHGHRSLSAIDLCDVTADSTLRGHRVFCVDDYCSTPHAVSGPRFGR